MNDSVVIKLVTKDGQFVNKTEIPNTGHYPDVVEYKSKYYVLANSQAVEDGRVVEIYREVTYYSIPS